MKKNRLEVKKAEPKDLEDVLLIWEDSVKGTHDFLKKEDFESLKQSLPTFLREAPINLWVFENELIAFSSHQAEQLDMLFIKTAYLGRGFGTEIIQRLLLQGVKTVDVNEQNTNAYRFYQKQGFKEVARSLTDGQGNTYPILHLKLK